ncbi:PDC sensor domain-containing protein [Marmoricola sp. URHA0025 HA25]
MTGLLDGILDDISELADQATDLLGSNPQLASAGLADLRPRIHRILREHTDLVIGAGVALAPDVLSDKSHHLEWWWDRGGRAAESLRVNLDPAAPDFYDYTTTDWYTTPQHTGRSHVSGPYVDYACTNSYGLTLAHPVMARSGVVAVVAADVPLARLEAKALPLLASRDECVVVNGHGRVILSTTPLVLPGMRSSGADRPSTERKRPYGDWRLILQPQQRD